ncbi:hypothetical protein EYY84_19860 [Hafnia alvei]|nr:hypothetical protein EYY84_19860 [Hafnia alvei]
MIENILIGVITGILSGLYTGLIISKYILFTSLRREALRIVRRIDYIQGDGYRNHESLPELALISSDLLSLNHKKAGATVMHVFADLNQEISRRDTNVNGEMMADAQRKLRELPVNKLCLINPFSLRT